MSPPNEVKGMKLNMKVNTKEELMALINYCRAIPYSDIVDGGSFYKVKAQSFSFPDGSIQTREYLDKKKASIVVPITNEGNVVFVIQPIALSEEGSLMEFPAGYWEFNESGLQAGIRELSEETGYVPNNIIYLGSHYQDPGSIRQKVEVYLALGCKRLHEQNLDKEEFIKYIEVPYEFAIELLDEGYLKDANSYIALSKSDKVLQKQYKNEQKGYSKKFCQNRKNVL